MISLSRTLYFDNFDVKVNIEWTKLILEFEKPIYETLEIEIPEFMGNTFKYNGINYYIPDMYKLKDSININEVTAGKLQLEIPTHFDFIAYEEVLLYYGIAPAIEILVDNYERGRLQKDKKVFEDIVQGQINNFLTTSSITRYMSGNVSCNKIIINIPNKPSLDLKFRIPQIKILPEANIDMASVSVSGKNVGLVASTKADKVFSNVMQNTFLPAHTRKVVGARSSIENSEDLLNPEMPMVYGKRNDISGTNLLAVCLTAKYNQYDAIMIRNHKDIIRKLTCIKHRSIIVPTDAEILVKKNKGVNPYAPLYKELNGRITKFDSHRKGTVINIEKLKNRSIIYIDCIYPLCNGDKLDTRNHYKGVVQLVDDDKMPIFEINENLNIPKHSRISSTHFIPDMVVDPIGIAKRANFSLLYEMAMSTSNILQCTSRKIDNTNLENLLVNGKYLDEEVKDVSCGFLFVFRPNKHAADSPIESDKITDIIGSHGWQRDTTSNGARVNLTMMMVLQEKFDINDIVEWSNLYRDNTPLQPYMRVLPEEYCDPN